MENLTTRADFLELLPPLNTEERARLEDSLKQYGCWDRISVWKEHAIIIDGHNRYEICSKNDIPFEIEELSFDNDDQVKLWMLKHQLSRRNINAFHRTKAQLLIKELEDRLNMESMPIPTQVESQSEKPESTTEDKPQASTKEVIAEVAKEAGVSVDMVRKVSYLDENADEEVKDKLMRGETTISREYQNLKSKEKKEPAPIKDKFIPQIRHTDVLSFLTDEKNQSNTFDLLLTEPPTYQEWSANGSLDEYVEFYRAWLHAGLALLKPTSRAFIFADIDIRVLNKLILVCEMLSTEDLKFEDLLIWTFKPSESDTSPHDFKRNWQGVLYFKGKSAPAVSGNKEMHTVLHFMKDVNNDFKYKDWRKPIPLIKKLIHLATNAGDSMLDPFAGSGHFLLTAGRCAVHARGCDNNQQMFDLAMQEGCQQIPLPSSI